MRTPIPAIVTGFVLTVFAMTPNPAHAADTPAPAAIELVREGDAQMTCPALATEINQLASLDAAPADTPKPKKKRGGLGFLKVLSTAVPFVGGMGGMIGGSLVSAASMAGQGSAQGNADEMMADSRAMMNKAMAGPSVASQRKDRLTEMFQQKGC